MTLGILLCTSGTGQEWSLVATTGPAPRSGATMAFDSLRGRTVLFGRDLGDTWEWDGSVWHPQFFGAGPSARYGHAMAFDSRRGVVVLFGGRDASPWTTWDHDDTWLWNGAAWVEVVTSVRPSGRNGHGMVFDSFRGRTVLHGGHGPLANETWEWNGAAGWALRATSGASVAGPLVFHGRLNRTVLLGSTANWDFWEWDGTSWATRQYQNAGPTVSNFAVAYDAAREEVIAFGGSGPNAETWTWSGTTWSLRAFWPSARSGAGMAFDSHRAVVVMFGGGGSTGSLGDTWHWTGPGSASAFGSGCGVPPLALTTSANARPIVGTTARATLTHVPSPFAFVAIGWSRSRYGPFPLPVTLASFGMPGCDLLQSAEVAAEPATISGPATATYQLILPNTPGLIGLRLFLQGWAVAPGSNAAGTIVSNGIEWIVGSA